MVERLRPAPTGHIARKRGDFFALAFRFAMAGAKLRRRDQLSPLPPATDFDLWADPDELNHLW